MRQKDLILLWVSVLLLAIAILIACHADAEGAKGPKICEIAPGVTFRAIAGIEDSEAWPSAYTPAEADWAAQGGMELSKRVAEAKADYYLGRVYTDRKFTFGPGDALVFRFGDAEIVSTALLTCPTCEQMELLTTERTGFSVGDWPPNTGDGGYLVIASFERGSIRVNRRWWKEGPDSVALAGAGKEAR